MRPTKYAKLVALRESVQFMADQLDRIIERRHTMKDHEDQINDVVTAFCAVAFDFGKLVYGR